VNIILEKRQVYSEVYEFINLLDIEFIEKIPNKLLNFFENEKDDNYLKNINPFENIENQNLKKDTITIINMLNLKYWANDEEKEKLQKKFIENNLKMQEKYSIDNIFDEEKIIPKSNEIKSKEQSSVELIKVENKNIFIKVFEFFKKIFKK
jgi:hypothetical protein